MTMIVVTGAGGFIGHHLVRALKREGHRVRGVDVRPPAWERSAADEFEIHDLRQQPEAFAALRGAGSVYALAADMGGMGYISANHATVLRNNILIDTNTIEAARLHGATSYLYASSACVYPEYRQLTLPENGLREEDAYPALPQDAYGWEKLLGERLCHYYREEFGLQAHVARLHNIFGPLGTWEGGREKAPAAICRKVAMAKLTGEHVVDVWGDGRQERSFCYIDDCLRGLMMLMGSSCFEPLNIGQERSVTIDQLVDLVASIAGISVEKRHVAGPEGVRARTSNNDRVHRLLGWMPEIPLERGLAFTYEWIEEQLGERFRAGSSRLPVSTAGFG
jgi:nucleoside-diphosphate-sugar epimerase